MKTKATLTIAAMTMALVATAGAQTVEIEKDGKKGIAIIGGGEKGEKGETRKLRRLELAPDGGGRGVWVIDSDDDEKKKKKKSRACRDGEMRIEIVGPDGKRHRRVIELDGDGGASSFHVDDDDEVRIVIVGPDGKRRTRVIELDGDDDDDDHAKKKRRAHEHGLKLKIDGADVDLGDLHEHLRDALGGLHVELEGDVDVEGVIEKHLEGLDLGDLSEHLEAIIEHHGHGLELREDVEEQIEEHLEHLFEGHGDEVEKKVLGLLKRHGEPDRRGVLRLFGGRCDDCECDEDDDDDDDVFGRRRARRLFLGRPHGEGENRPRRRAGRTFINRLAPRARARAEHRDDHVRRLQDRLEELRDEVEDLERQIRRLRRRL